MRRSYRILPTYTGDVSGVCSALYELGGMVVIHDPSGCNSTYNTHDETRWYDQESLIYISGLSEMDAILGNDDKFVADIVRAAKSLSPRFIALTSAPIPFMNGTDFPGLARVIEQETDIPTFFVKTNGMHDYIAGAGEAFRMLAERFVLPREEILPRSVNVLGLTPLDYAAPGSREAMELWLAAHDFQIISCWGMGGTLDDIAMAGSASVNLVVSAMGWKAAQYMEKKFHIPYVVGCPISGFRERLISAIEEAEERGISSIPYLTGETRGECPVALIGEPVTMGSLAAAISIKHGFDTVVHCPLEECDGLFDGIRTQGEAGAEVALSGSGIVIADPMYRNIVQGAEFYDLPHEALSGRCFRKTMKNLLHIGV